MNSKNLLSASKPLQNQRVLLAVTGSIAACKADRIIKVLRNSGARVQVLLTEDGARFFPPQTAGALTGQPVLNDMWSDADPGEMIHLEAIENSDLILVAPATANRILQIKHPAASDLLSTVITAFRGPVFYAPAMNPRLWKNKELQKIVNEYQEQIIAPVNGVMACGDVGPGRLAEPENIVETLIARWWPELFAGQKWFVSGGGSKEAWDDIRYLGNRSSGRMGEALARQLARLGADVELVTAAQEQFYPNPGYSRVEVETAADMHEYLQNNMDNNSGYIGAAAVADYRPVSVSGKIKSGQDELTVKLKKNPDIISELRKSYPEAILVGFSADDSRGPEKAGEKARSKQLDAVVFNSLRQHDGGMGSEFNRNVFIVPPNFIRSLGRANKNEIALQLLLWLEKLKITPGVN
ncbi:MAG: bifunctional phosphopantothenoylcysteine decarboxylase/phosphopantothenate--cysteine ligase CoaBC [bacterium]